MNIVIRLFIVSSFPNCLKIPLLFLVERAPARTVGTVLVLLLLTAWNNTAYYPSTADLQSSLTMQNSCSSEFTLRTMFYVSLLVPFVLAYIIYAWHSIDKKEITLEEINNDHAY